jgi:hypothetical protein
MDRIYRLRSQLKSSVVLVTPWFVALLVPGGFVIGLALWWLQRRHSRLQPGMMK